MSRRSRKRSAEGENRWLGKAAVALLVFGVIALGGGYALIRGYLHSDAFRKFLSIEASEMARVTGEFAPFRWEGLAVDTDSFEATGSGPVTALRADGLHTEIGLGGVTRGVWEVRGSNLRRLEISLDSRKRPVEAPPEVVKQAKAVKKASRQGWFPSEAELQGIDVRELVVRMILDQGLVVASGMRVHAEPAGAKGAYRADIDGGTLRLPFEFITELRLDRARLRYQDGRVFLTEATLGAWENGRIHGTGEWETKSRRFSMEGEVTGLKCEDLLGADWSKRLTGGLDSTFTSNNHNGFSEASGKLTLQNGVLTALPMLDALAAYADTRRFRVLALNEAHTGWQWNKNELLLKNLVLSSEGLVRLEGSLAIRGQELDGNFRLGLAPGTLSTIPGAETDVFVAGERGLLWTTLRITGTRDHPKEDLTDRLIAAAGMRMFDRIPETGEEVIKFTHSVLRETSPKTLEKGLKIIEKNKDTIREVSGILDGILGGSRREKPKKQDEAQ
jgi:hypothetical protein